MVQSSKPRYSIQAKIFEFSPSGRTQVESAESEFSALEWPKRVRNPGEKLRITGAKFQSAGVALCTLQSATPALRNFVPLARKVFSRIFYPF